MTEAARSFRYLADPCCIISLAIYPINRFYLKPHHIGGWFTHGYLNDVLCLPMFVPIILYAQHLLGLRPHYRFPSAWEIFQNFAVFTIVFQVITPRFPKAFTSAGDPLDIIAYAAGGIVAGCYWFYAERKTAGGIKVPSAPLTRQNIQTPSEPEIFNHQTPRCRGEYPLDESP